MSIQEPIEPSLQQKFQAEKLLRIIQDCEDLEILREIAIELLKLNQKKTAIAEWSTRRAWEAEQIKFKEKF